MNVFDICLFNDFHMNFVGFRSGEYDGRYMRHIFNFAAHIRVSGEWWGLKLSITATILPSGFLFLMRERKSIMSSFLEFSWKSTALLPFRE
jgi:hypothetical protein